MAHGDRTPTRSLPPFERVLEEHGFAVLGFCVSQVGVQRGEDCFQETMLAALRAYEGLRDPSAVRSWLFSIAARKALDAHRAQAKAPEPTDDIGAAAATEDPGGRDEVLWQQVRALPDKQRHAVTLRYRADLTYGEIACVMGISEAAARRNAFEGLNRLRRENPAT